MYKSKNKAANGYKNVTLTGNCLYTFSIKTFEYEPITQKHIPVFVYNAIKNKCRMYEWYYCNFSAYVIIMLPLEVEKGEIRENLLSFYIKTFLGLK
jgi:hypothetical protein